MSPRDKGRLFTEFKSTLLDKSFQKIKKLMLDELNTIDYCVIYSCHIKKTEHFSQDQKEATYIYHLRLISEEVAKDCVEQIEIVFDTFNKTDFEAKIIDEMSALHNVSEIYSYDSQMSPGLQFVDNLCSVCRHHLSGTDKNSFFEMIKKYVKVVWREKVSMVSFR